MVRLILYNLFTIFIHLFPTILPQFLYTFNTPKGMAGGQISKPYITFPPSKPPFIKESGTLSFSEYKCKINQKPRPPTTCPHRTEQNN